MALKDNISFTEYVKLNEMKGFVLAHLERMGLKEQVRTMNDEDIEKIMYMMSLMGEQLKEKDNDIDKIEMLVSYVICMWARLIVDYNAPLSEL